MIGKLYINGQSITRDKKFPVKNPFTQNDIGQYSFATAEDVESAINSASVALESFKSTLPLERSKLLTKIYEIVLRDREEYAQLITLEQGKSIHEARSEVDYALSFLQWFAEEAKRVYGEVIPSTKPNQHQYSIYKPIGVVAIITPWNFPLAMLVRKVAPLLAAGCCAVIKPSEETPFTAEKFIHACKEAGVKDGVLNLVVGDANAIGDILCSSKSIKMLTFTGSTRVGKILMAKCASTVKRVCLELGGNAPFIVFDDCDINLAVNSLVASKLRSGGQSCICANKILVQNGIFEEFKELLISKLAPLRVGNGADESIHLGPLINRAAKRRLDSLLKDALDGGSELLFDGTTEITDSETVLGFKVLKVKNLSCKVVNEEIFGPIIPLVPFNDEKEALSIANNTDYGLAAYIFSNSLQLINHATKHLEYGMIGINDVAISNPFTPFGGVKESGLGREGGRHGILEFLEEQFISLNY